MRKSFSVVFFLLGLALPVVANALGFTTRADSVGAPVLKPGDAILITVWRREELSGEFSILETGEINHPLYRSVNLGGLTYAQAEASIRDFLRVLETDPQFVIQPLVRVSVGGEVRNPNLYKLFPETTVAEAVAQAGGVSDRGRIDKIRLLRKNREVKIDLTDLADGSGSLRVESGDLIYVERRSSIFREYIAPAGSLIAALVSVANFITR